MRTALLLCLLPLLLPATPQARRQDPQPPAAAAPEPTLKGTMKQINRRMRALRELLEAAEPAAAPLPLVEELQQLALAAKGLQPSRLADVPPDGEAEFLLGFRRQMHSLLGQLFELEIALLEARQVDALKLLAVLEATKKEGHDRYKAKRD